MHARRAFERQCGERQELLQRLGLVGQKRRTNRIGGGALG